MARTILVCPTDYPLYDGAMRPAKTSPSPVPVGADSGPDDLGIVDALAQLSFAIQGTLERRTAGHGLSLAQARLLGVLRDREPSMQELARLLGTDKSSVTGLVDRAERRGLVCRAADPLDRRSVRDRLTPEGRRSVARVVRAFERDVATMTRGLSPAETTALSRLATRIVSDNPSDGTPGSLGD